MGTNGLFMQNAQKKNSMGVGESVAEGVIEGALEIGAEAAEEGIGGVIGGVLEGIDDLPALAIVGIVIGVLVAIGGLFVGIFKLVKSVKRR